MNFGAGEDMGRPAKITIHLDALQHNLVQIKKFAPRSNILAMVKSNAYGHGLERIALALPEVDAFGVACIEEGLALRQAGIQKPIVLMEGLFTENELQSAYDKDFSLVIHHAAQADMLLKNPPNRPLSIWLKINTGMNRLGFCPSAFKKAYDDLTQLAHIKKPLCLMTHFAESDLLHSEATSKQIKKFNKTVENFSGLKSLCNSAGIIAWPSAHQDWVRPGIMLYGISPFVGHRGVEHHLRPVMSLSSALIAIQKVSKGERVGYGGTWQCPEDMTIGVVGIGYGDGYPQFAKTATPVLVNKHPCPLIGKVSMDMLTVDLRTQPQAKIGDPVLLWGPGLPVEVVAESNNTSAYELVTRMMQRVPVGVVGLKSC